MKIWLKHFLQIGVVLMAVSCAFLEQKSRERKKLTNSQFIYQKTIEHSFKNPMSAIWDFPYPSFGMIIFQETPNAPIICKGYRNQGYEPLFEVSINEGTKLDITPEVQKIKCFSPKVQAAKFTLFVKDIPLSEAEFPVTNFQKLVDLRKKYRGLYKDLTLKRYSVELDRFLKENRFYHERYFNVRTKDGMKPLAVIHRDEQIYIKHVKGEVTRQHVNVQSFGPKGQNLKNPPKHLLATKYPPYSLLCGSINSDETFNEIYFFGQGPYQYQSKENLSIFCTINHRLDKEEFLKGEFEFVYQIIPEDVQTIIVSTLARLEGEIAPMEQKKHTILEQKLSTLP